MSRYEQGVHSYLHTWGTQTKEGERVRSVLNDMSTMMEEDH